jgi:hypothetical protein
MFRGGVSFPLVEHGGYYLHMLYPSKSIHDEYEMTIFRGGFGFHY